MDALSGLDPKYIDEAAFELHGRPVKKSNPNKSKIMRGVFIALPIAAAALITVMVALPAIFRTGSSSSPSMSAETGSYAPAAGSDGAASDASASYEAAEEPSWDYEAAEEPSYDAAEETETAAVADTASEEASNASASAKDEPMASTETAGSAEPSETETAGAEISAEYADGILTIENITLPEDVSEVEYTIYKTTAAGRDIIYDTGYLGDILTETEPLTLDISDLMLPEATYSISIGDEVTEFTVVR